MLQNKKAFKHQLLQ